MIKTIQTENYELQVECIGDEHSPFVYKHQPGQIEHNQLPHIQASLEFMANLGYYAISPNPVGIRGSRRLKGDGTIDEYTLHNQTDSGIELNNTLVDEYTLHNQTDSGIELNNTLVDEYTLHNQTDSGIELNKTLVDEYSKRIIISAGNSAGCRPAAWEAAIQNSVKGYVSIFGAATWLRGQNLYERTIEWGEKGHKDILIDPPNGGPPEFVRVPYNYSITAPPYDAHKTIKSVYKPKLFIGGVFDKIVLKEDVDNFYNAAPEPKELAWIESNHFYLPQNEASVQEAAEEEMKKQFEQNGYTDIIPPIRRYSNAEIIHNVNETIADWLERNQLLPTQIGKLAFRHY